MALSGFSIELLNHSYRLRVQDNFLNSISGAQVVVTDLTDFEEHGVTDANGIFFGNAERNVTYQLTIKRDGFFEFSHRFRIISSNDLDYPSNNFPVLIYDESDSPISGAQVDITSQYHSNSGTTDSNGLYQGIVRADSQNEILVDKIGFSEYSQIIYPYIKLDPAFSDEVVVPIIVLT